MIAEPSVTTGSTMDIHQAMIILSLLWGDVPVVLSTCESHEFINPFPGHYCPTGGITILNMSWHQCKFYCMHNSGCQAVNFNSTANICIRLSTTCAKAISHPETSFALFTGQQADQCYQWIAIETEDDRDDGRSLSEDNERFVARVQKNGNDLGAFFLAGWRECISGDQDGPIKTSVDGHPCQYLRITNGCTAYYVDYVLGAPLPHNALIAGYTAEGMPVYIVLY